jgi:hypothetical protein
MDEEMKNNIENNSSYGLSVCKIPLSNSSLENISGYLCPTKKKAIR